MHVEIYMSEDDLDLQTQLEDYDFEPCEEINQADESGDLEQARGTLLLGEVRSCSTATVNGLSQQLINEMNLIIPNVVVSFKDLNVNLGDAAWPFLQPAAKKGLEQAIKERGIPLRVNSAYRTLAQQVLLFNHKQGGRCGITRAARPGRSNHQSGLALDIQDHLGWKPFLERHGWKWFGASDKPHFDFVGSGTKDIRSTATLAFQKLWNKHNPGDLLKEDSDFGDETLKRMNRCPADGFGAIAAADATTTTIRELKLTDSLMQGDDVLQLQNALVKAGFTLKLDKFFGNDTHNTVKAFQKQAGLTDDGVVGSRTRQALGL
jgi:N-acetylmuramoyl-L-alanine amidase